MPLSAGSHVGPFEIVSPLGAGGMGEVYRARDSKLARDVALKVLPAAFASDPDRMARFQREAQVLASLNHPHIAAIYGLEESGAVRALVMELVEGPTLAERVALGPIPIAEALPMARQIAEALEAAHEKGIVHRDLKPANIKLTGDGNVKVLDFGLAKAMEGKSVSGEPTESPTLTLAMTGAGVILGTASYMSPEQAKGKSVDRRADIWAFGIVLIEMLTGQRMYAGETVSETLAAVIMTAPSLDTLPADTPAAIRKLLGRCLEKDPRRRLRDIGEARIAIEDVLSGATSEQSVAAPALPPPVRRTPIGWIAAAVLLLATAALSWIHFRETPAAERSLRYTVAVPAKNQLHSLALSPDGHYLAIASVQDTKHQLWLRALDALEAQPLPGTDGATYPFWSPDSRYIGYFADGKLAKIAAAGGPAQVLCDAPNGRGGAWNRDGVILFAPSPNGGLQRVPQVGGVPVQVTTTKANHRFPIFLPDGRHFLYLVSTDAPDKNGIMLGSIDGKESRRLLADASSVLFVPALAGSRYGHLLLIRQDTLMAQPVDGKTFQLAGDLFPIAQRVFFGANNNYMPVAASENGVLVYMGNSTAMTTQLAWYERSGKPLGSVGAPGAVIEQALSPDGRSIAIPRFTDQFKTSDIWLRDLSRGTETRFTFNASRQLFPIWSPRGDQIAFSSDRGTPGRFDMYLKASSGAAQEELLHKSDYNQGATSWSEDGLALAYIQEEPKTKLDLWVLLNPAGKTEDRKAVPFLQTEFNEIQGQFSPDGRWMAYSSDESGRWEVYVRPYPAADGKWQVSTAGGEMPRWRRDGKELYYVAPDKKLMSVPVKAAVGKAAFEAGTPEVLFHAPMVQPVGSYRPYTYDVTADGKRFLLATVTGADAESPLTVVVNWAAAARR